MSLPGEPSDVFELTFQDYDRYNLTVRQNVGFGDTDQMVSLDALFSRDTC